MENFEFQKVKLKPFYRIVETETKLFIMMAPMEVIEIPKESMAKGNLWSNLRSNQGLAIEEVIKETESNEEITNLLKELWSHGFLMSLDGIELLSPKGFSEAENWLFFLCRFTNKPYEVFFRLKNQKIGIFAPNGILGEQVCGLLNNVPFFTNQLQFFPGDSFGRDALTTIDFGIVISNGFYPAFFLDINKIALEVSKTFLPIILLPDTTLGIIGPLIKKGEGACWNCFYRRYSSQGTNLAVYELLSKLPMLNNENKVIPWNISLLFHLLLPEIIFAVTNIQIPKTLGSVLFIDFVNLSITEHSVLVLPECECSVSQKTKNEVDLYSPFGF